MTCSIMDCHGSIEGLGYCSKHYQRFKRHGDPLKTLTREHGEGFPHPDGYWMHQIDGRRVMLHVLVAEKALGRPLPPKAEVHHVNEIKKDNRNRNLVICEDHAYHALLHQRQRALVACGQASWRPCNICRQYDAPENLYVPPNGRTIYHRRCTSKGTRL
jgi:HNH endonuclease